MVIYTICRVPPRARYLPLRYAEKALGSGESSSAAAVPEELEPGQERLYSYYEPPLVAGPHLISTRQDVTQKCQTSLEIKDEQRFTVVAPRYTLPDGSIHSVYPPQGHAENVEILPHVVLNDPHLPWTRKVTEVADPVRERNRVPWLALLVFTQEELRLPDLNIFQSIQTARPIQQSNTLAVNLSLEELSKTECNTPVINPTTSAPWDGDSSEIDIRADFIFVKKNLFNALFKNQEETEQATPHVTDYSVSRYQWLAHMRQINTTGMANSGIDGEKGSFGVVVSHRTGPLDVTEPTDVVVHLVSIENIPLLKPSATKDRVALCSLDSWSYTCLPPNSFNIYDGFRHLGFGRNVLRVDVEQVKKRMIPGKSLPDPLQRRLMDGYVMTRYRTQTGEETAAWVRGPFVPTIVAHVVRPASSSGTELQIIDRKTGIMDVTYSVAWQLGKTLALADQGFATALGRLRLVSSRTASHEAKKTVLKRAGVFQDRHETLRGLADSLMTLRNLHPDGLMSGPDARWRLSPSISLDLSHSGALMQQHFSNHVAPIVKRLTGSTTEGEVYNELNTPLSPDWMVVLSWVLDRMYLSGIPAHYFLPDPAYLPVESLRFFHVDRNWVDALVDGAFSIANHLPNDDTIPGEFKRKINEYLEQKPKGLTYPPQRPGYGFLLRSELCVKFPDLIVEAYGHNTSKPDPSLILRQENITEGVLLVMFAEKPGGPGLEKLILREPPHQQAFSAGAELRANSLQVAYKKIFTIPLSEQDMLKDRNLPVCDVKHRPSENEPVFVWEDGGVNVHSLRLPAYAKRVHKALIDDNEEKSDAEKYYTETKPTATLMGIQLNHPMWYLEIRIDSRLFATLSHLSGDDGILTGLKMLHPPERSLRQAGETETIWCPSSDVRSIDWHAPFVASLETSHYLRQGDKPVALPPAPHMRRIAPFNLSEAQPSSSTVTSTNNLWMKYTIYSLKKPLEKSTVSEPKKKQDLVFSLSRVVDSRGRTGVGFNLRWITISIPVGTPSVDVPTLTDQEEGLSATMIRDFRFNVALTLTSDRKTLVITVVPRAETLSVSVTEGLCFMLKGVMVSDYKDWKSPHDPIVTLKVREEYADLDALIAEYHLKLQLEKGSNH